MFTSWLRYKLRCRHCKGQHADVNGAGLAQDTRAGVHRGAGRVNIINQHNPRTKHHCFRRVRDAKCAANIFLPLAGTETDLMTCWPGTHKELGAVCPVRQMRHGARQFRRLVVAPLDQTMTMKRNRHDMIRLRESIMTCPDHPAGHHLGQIRPVAEFQAMHQRARRPFMNCHRTMPIEIRRVSNGFQRHDPLAHVMRERQAKYRTTGFLDQSQFRPAFLTKPAMVAMAVCAGLADQAYGWKQDPHGAAKQVTGFQHPSP